MAFLSQNQMQGDDDEQKKYATSSSPAGTAAGGGGGGTTGGGASGAAPAQQSAGAPGTGFVNAQQFLNANQSGAQALGQGLNTAVQGEAATAAKDWATYNSDQMTTGGAAPSAALGPAADQAAQQKYQAAQAKTDSDHMKSDQSNQRAQFDANALTDNQSRTALLQNQYGNGPGGYSLGQTNWDNMLATQGLGNAGMFLKTQQQVTGQLAGQTPSQRPALGSNGGVPVKGYGPNPTTDASNPYAPVNKPRPIPRGGRQL